MKSFYNSLIFKQFWSKWAPTRSLQQALPCLLCGGKLTAHQASSRAIASAQAVATSPPILTHAPHSATSHGLPICRYCEDALPWYFSSKCPQCALPVAHAAHCGQCLQHPPAFDQTQAVFQYGFPLDRCLQHFKYAQQLVYGELLVKLMLQHVRLEAFDPMPTVMVAMPMHVQRLSQRGFNHAYFLAQQLHLAWGIPLIMDGCQRLTNTPTQAGLTMKIRTQNLRRAFATSHDWQGQQVLLVDDVMTTGASLHALAKVFKSAGAASVSAIVLARTLKPGD